MTMWKHLIVDGYGDSPMLTDKKMLRSWLRKMTNFLGMKVLGGPWVSEVKGFGPQAGITGVVVVSESHLAVHTWPEMDGLVNFDVFSCREYDEEAVIEVLKKDWQLAKVAWTLVRRPMVDGAIRESYGLRKSQ